MALANELITEDFVTEVAQLWPPRGQWTESDYFQLPESNRLIELSEGEITIMPPPSDTHQRLVGNLYRLLYAFVAAHQLGIVRFAPLAVRLWPGKIREPDLLFISHEHADRLGEYVHGPPDLAVEVISPTSRTVDRVTKFGEYAQAGISEYWLVDPAQEVVEVFVLEQSGYEGYYELLVKAMGTEMVRSRVLTGFETTAVSIFRA